jgi:hypothetical protein
MKLAEINSLMEQMTAEIAVRQDMLTVLHRLKQERAAAKTRRGTAQQEETERTEKGPREKVPNHPGHKGPERL